MTLLGKLGDENRRLLRTNTDVCVRVRFDESWEFYFDAMWYGFLGDYAVRRRMDDGGLVNW